MSKTELTRIEVMQRLEEKRLKQKEAAEMLGIGTRHIMRRKRSGGCHSEGVFYAKNFIHPIKRDSSVAYLSQVLGQNALPE